MRTVVVGLGWVATEVWLPRLLAHPAITVVGAVEPTVAAAGRAAGLLGDLPVHADYRDVPVDEVDLVFVLTPNHTHAEIAEWFLRRGRRVVLEKPNCTRVDEIDRIAAAAADGGGSLALSAAARHRTDVSALRDVVASGRLGTPRLAELSWVRGRGIPQRHWFTDSASAGGGALVDLGWHVLDVAHDLWGPVRVRAAVATATADFLRRRDGAALWQPSSAAAPAGARACAGDVEDQLTGLVTTDSYALGLRFAWASHEEVDRTTITLHGTDASARLRTTFGFSPHRLPRASLRVRSAGEVEEVALPDTTVGAEYDRLLDDLVTADDDTTTKRSLDCVRDVLSIVEACYSSAAPVP
ncbi:Gfo/Idh/MocA family protein [Micromonospora sp. NPDC050397]|uniref:Gfo/Idh/MocA family protein n=1 Tax=Micromonospora sp. NPDC050397 TaxID=3364279 RepID=UPI00384F3B70